MSWYDVRVDLSGAGPRRRRPRVGGVLMLAVVLAVGGGVASLVGSLTGAAADSRTLGLVLRTVLVAAFVCVTTHLACRRDAHGLPRSAAWLAGLLGYLLAPTSWVGETMLAAGLGLDGLVAAGGDLLLWLGCLAVGVVAAVPDERRSGDPVVDSLLRR